MSFYHTIYNSDDRYVKELERLKKSQQEKLKKIDKLFSVKKNEYSSNFTRSFKRRIIERDKECQLCGKREDLEVHHILYEKAGTNKNFCITLCKTCNLNVNRKDKREYYKNFFSSLLHYKLNR